MTSLDTSAAAQTEELVDRLDVLSGELHVLNDILGELREEIQWAVTNGRLVVALSDTESLDDGREATNSADAITLTIRLNAALATLRQEVAHVIEQQRSSPVASSHNNVPVDVSERPQLMLLEAGDAVEFDLDGETWFGEIARLEDAENLAVVMLIPTFEEVEVSQDNLRRIEPDELTQREDEIGEALTEPDDADAVPPLRVGDVFTIADDGCDYQAEVLTIDRDNQSADLLLSPSMETVTIDWDDAVSLKTPSIRQRTLF